MTTGFFFDRRGEPPLECDALPQADERRGAPLGLTVHVKVPGSDYAFDGVIEHFFGGEASILLKHRFQKKTPVSVELNGFKFGGEVLYCERKGDVFDTHVLLADQDEAGIRRDPRYVVNLAGRIYVPGNGEGIEATLIDISRDGIGLECGSALTVGDTIAVESQLNLAFGVVRHSRRTKSGRYRGGVEVHTVITKGEVAAEQQRSPSDAEKHESWVRGIIPRLLSGRT